MSIGRARSWRRGSAHHRLTRRHKIGLRVDGRVELAGNDPVEARKGQQEARALWRNLDHTDAQELCDSHQILEAVPNPERPVMRGLS